MIRVQGSLKTAGQIIHDGTSAGEKVVRGPGASQVGGGVVSLYPVASGGGRWEADWGGGGRGLGGNCEIEAGWAPTSSWTAPRRPMLGQVIGWPA
jgi:hypothetical protein